MRKQLRLVALGIALSMVPSLAAWADDGHVSQISNDEIRILVDVAKKLKQLGYGDGPSTGYPIVDLEALGRYRKDHNYSLDTGDYGVWVIDADIESLFGIKDPRFHHGPESQKRILRVIEGSGGSPLH